MKYLLLLGALTFVSCGNGVKDWDMSAPNDSSMMASNMMEPRYYSSDSTGLERSAMTDRETRELTRKKKDDAVKLSGEMSVGVGRQF